MAIGITLCTKLDITFIHIIKNKERIIMYFRKNLMKEKLQRGEMVLGMEVWTKSTRIIELLGYAGFDFAHIENEHVAHNWETVENLIITAESVGLTAHYRTEQCFDGQPPVNEIIKALKCGAQNIMVPHVDTAEAAKKVVAAAKYPPLGRRGIATCDRAPLGIPATETLDIQKFTQEANEQLLLWAIVESPEGVENIDGILDAGIDVVVFGHQDYSIAAGLTSETDAAVDKARKKVRDAVLSRKNKYLCLNTKDMEIIKEQRKLGTQIFLISVDVVHLNNLFKSMIKELKG